MLRHPFTAAVNNLTDVSLEWVPDLSGTYSANAYKEYIDGRNLWLSYTYTF